MYCFTGESCCGQRALYPLGMTGIPIYNVNNNCSTGSSALILAQQLVAGGIAECVLAVGFEKMKKGSLTGKVLHQLTQLLVRICVNFLFCFNRVMMIVLTQWTVTWALWLRTLALNLLQWQPNGSVLQELNT